MTQVNNNTAAGIGGSPYAGDTSMVATQGTAGSSMTSASTVLSDGLFAQSGSQMNMGQMFSRILMTMMEAFMSIIQQMMGVMFGGQTPGSAQPGIEPGVVPAEPGTPPASETPTTPAPVTPAGEDPDPAPTSQKTTTPASGTQETPTTGATGTTPTEITSTVPADGTPVENSGSSEKCACPTEHQATQQIETLKGMVTEMFTMLLEAIKGRRGKKGKRKKQNLFKRMLQGIGEMFLDKTKLGSLFQGGKDLLQKGAGLLKKLF